MVLTRLFIMCEQCNGLWLLTAGLFDGLLSKLSFYQGPVVWTPNTSNNFRLNFSRRVHVSVKYFQGVSVKIFTD